MNIAKPILYVSKDPERAGNLPCISGKETLDLLKEVPKGKTILVFKNNKAIEDYCNQNQITLLNPPAELAEKIENKITQVELFKEFLPEYQISKVKDIKMQTPFVLQWAHGHTGEGTLYVENLDQIKNFPERECRVTKYIEGKTFTVNIVVGNTVEVGNISEQITGLAPYTDNRFATVGNDWSVKAPYGMMEMAQKIGEKMKTLGWLGMFGIDFLESHLIEINARQTNSATYESTLQKTNTIFENHIKALLGEPLHKNTVINSGKQIIDRRTMTWIRE